MPQSTAQRSNRTNHNPVPSGELFTGAHAASEHRAYTPGGVFLPVSALVVCALLVFLVLHFFRPDLSPAMQADANRDLTDPQQEEHAIAAVFTPEVRRWEPQLVAWAAAAGLDPDLLATVMQIESCGDAGALSRSGAMGLFQVMPFHFMSGEDGFDPETNARRGAAYLRQALDARGGDVRTAFAGYNGGINGASLPESQWAEETLRYVYWGTGIYQDARKRNSQSTVLQEWLSAGGTDLCARAARNTGGGSGIASNDPGGEVQAVSRSVFP